MRLSEILRTKGGAVVTIAPDATVTEVLGTLSQYRVGALVVSTAEPTSTSTVSVGGATTGVEPALASVTAAAPSNRKPSTMSSASATGVRSGPGGGSSGGSISAAALHCCDHAAGSAGASMLTKRHGSSPGFPAKT